MKNLSKSDIHHLTSLISRLPDESPPADLTQVVMRQIKPRRMGLGQRLRMQLRQPALAISMRPVQVALMAMVLIGVFFAFKMTGIRPTFFTPAGNLDNVQTKMVNFILDWPSAETVAVIGSFNNWQPDQQYQMRRNQSDGTWQLSIRIEPGRHAYAFIIDGTQVIADPRALWEQDDGFGTRNSILTIENGYENGSSDDNHI